MREYTKSYLSSEDWKEVLLELDSIGNAYSRRILEVINCLFKSSNYKLNAKAIGETIGTAYQRLNSDIGGFGGLFTPNMEGMKEPTLVMGTDGVGTKLKLAFSALCNTSSG